MLTSRNQLPPMQALDRPTFEALFSQFKVDFLSALAEANPAQAIEVEQTLAIEGELITKLLQAFTQYLIGNTEAENHKAQQMLPGYAEGHNLDQVVALQGIKRQVISEGDASALPPILPVQETDDQLLQRFWLAPHAPAAGTRLHYKYTLLTLDDAPEITLDKPSNNQVRLTYTFGQGDLVTQVRDGNGRRTDLGEVTLTVLASTGQGEASEPLQHAVAQYFKRDDVGMETDHIRVQSAGIVTYTQTVQVWITSAPDVALVKARIEHDLNQYAQQQWRLGGQVQRSYIDYIAHQAGAQSVRIDGPLNDIITADDQAPFCTAVSVTVHVL